MKLSPALLALFCAALVVPAAARANLLLNGDFEVLVSGTTNNSNNIGTVPPDWTVANGSGTTDSTLSNLVLGTANGNQAPGATTTTTLAPYLDGSSTHNQSLDGKGVTVDAIQNFTLGTASPLNVSAVFGGRDYQSNTAGNASNWTISTQANPGTILAQGTPTLTPQGVWTIDAGTTATLPAGDYRFTVILSNPDQLDAAVITPIPEPSTLAAIAGGLCLLGLRSRRSSRRR